MNIVYSSSDEYCRHLGVSITSLYRNHLHVPAVKVYIISYGIGDDNKQRLNEIAKKFDREISYLSFGDFESKVCPDGSYLISKNSYSRLFLSEILPNDVERVIWLDCDTVVTDSLEGLYNMDLQGKSLAAVQDCGSGVFYEEIGVNDYYRYICAGVFLADLKKWRQSEITKKFLDFMDYKKGHFEHVDQTIINGVLYKDCVIIHPRYDVLTPTFVMPYHNLIEYFKLDKGYYSKEEIRESIKNPAIIHYTSSNTGRPWEKGNKHPKARIYVKYWRESAWKDEPWGEFTPRMGKSFHRAYWLYQHVPVSIIRFIVKCKSLICK